MAGRRGGEVNKTRNLQKEGGVGGWEVKMFKISLGGKSPPAPFLHVFFLNALLLNCTCCN